MSTLEAGLRSGAIAVLLLLAIVAWRDARRAAAARLTVLFDLCAIAYLIETTPAFAAARPWIVPVQLLSMSTPAVFWHWAAASFDDFFVPRWWRWLPFTAMIALSATAIATDWPTAWRAARIAALLLVVIGIWQTLAGREGDLIEGRRRFRLVFAIGAGFWIAVLTLLGASANQNLRAAAGVVSAGGVLALALAWALLRLRHESFGNVPLGREPWGGPSPEPVASGGRPPPVAIDGEDRVALDRLQTLMERDRIYREEGVSLARLAVRLAIPEYRLRRLINQHLGHRNFTSFVNGYRLTDAMAALSDPSQRQVPVLTIALDAGFQSIGPFNRAFRAQTGMTPSEFRRDRLESPTLPAGR